jgi:hypothetical protein
MTGEGKAIFLAEQVLEKADDYPQPMVQYALMLLTDPESESMQAMFLEMHQCISVIKSISVGKGLPYPPDAASYYLPSELNQPGVEIGIEPINNWAVRIFDGQFRRHIVVTGMSGSGKSNLLKLIALGLGEIDK